MLVTLHKIIGMIPMMKNYNNRISPKSLISIRLNFINLEAISAFRIFFCSKVHSALFVLRISLNEYFLKDLFQFFVDSLKMVILLSEIIFFQQLLSSEKSHFFKNHIQSDPKADGQGKCSQLSLFSKLEQCQNIFFLKKQFSSILPSTSSFSWKSNLTYLIDIFIVSKNLKLK